MLVELQNKAIQNLKQVIEYAENNNLTNTQTFLTFLDQVNEISVKY